MAYEVKNLLGRRLGIEVSEVTEKGIVTLANHREEACNHYGMAHGGYLHTLAHISMILDGEIRLGGAWEVADAFCEYLRALRAFPVKTVTTQIGNDPTAPVYLAEVFDAKGALCYTQTSALRRAAEVKGEPVVHTPLITSASPMPKDLDVEPPFPCYSTSYSKWLNCYSIRKQGTGLVYALDLCEANCDEMGNVFPAAVFTLGDSAVGGSLVRIERKNPLTVCASMRFLKHSSTSLVAAIPRLVRGGKKLFYYDVDIVDGAGEVLAVGQFVIQSLE